MKTIYIILLVSILFNACSSISYKTQPVSVDQPAVIQDEPSEMDAVK